MQKRFFAEILNVVSPCFAIFGIIRNSHQPSLNIYEKEATFVSIYYCFFSCVFELVRFVYFTGLRKTDETVVRIVLPRSLVFTSGKRQIFMLRCQRRCSAPRQLV